MDSSLRENTVIERKENSMSKRKVKVGIIGSGNISGFHKRGYERSDARIVHISDINPEAAKADVEHYGCRFSTDYRQLLADPEVEAVSICTVNALHKECSLAAIGAGKHVLTEKTLATNAADAAEVAAAARAKPEIVCHVGYMKRFFPALQKAKELVPELGQIRSVHGWSRQNAEPTLFEHNSAYPKPADGTRCSAYQRCGGGCLNMVGSHIIDLLLYLVGRPEWPSTWSAQHR